MAVAHEEFVCLFPCIANARSLAIGSGNDVNRIGVLMIEDKNIIIPTTGGVVEMISSLIGVGLQERLIVEEQNSNLKGGRYFIRNWNEVEILDVVKSLTANGRVF